MRNTYRGLLSALLAASVYCQVPTGTIEGRVINPGGEVVAGASVTISETATGRVLEFQTNEAGIYSAGFLVPGVYSVRFEAAGYQNEEITGITLESGAKVDASAHLSAGEATFTITKVAQADSVQALRHTVDTVISASEIKNYPLVGRNFLDLAVLAPGVSVGAASTVDPTKASAAYRRVGIAGRLGTGTRVQVDGIDITDAIAGGTVLNVSPEAVHEFQLSQSSLDASAPLTSSGSIQVATKAGTNQFHGTGFWNYYNQDMAARPNYEPSVLPFSRQQAGGSFGGPILRNRLFFSVAGEQTRSNTTATLRNLQFPQINVNSTLRSPYRSLNGRVDWLATKSLRIFGSYLSDWNSTPNGVSIPTQNDNWASAVTAGADYTRNAWSHSYRFGFTNYNNRIDEREGDIPFNRTPEGTPYLLNVGTYSVGPSTLAPQATGESSWQNLYNGAWLHGRHSLRFGGSVNRVVSAGSFAPGQFSVAGLYNNTTLAAIAARGGDTTNPLEFPLNSFVVAGGAGYAFLASGHGFPYGAHFDTRTQLYFSDSIRLRNLTLTAGLKWNYGSGYLLNDRRVPMDPILERWLPGGSQFPAAPKKMFSPQFGFAWDPLGNSKTVIRGGFSLAYETVVHNVAGFGEGPLLPSALAGAAYNISFVAGPDGVPINVDGQHPTGDYTNLIGRPIKDVIGLIGQVDSALTSAYRAYRPQPDQEINTFRASRGTAGALFPGNQFKPPYSLQFNIGVQHELWKGTVLTADYIHNRGVGLPLTGANFERPRDSAFLDRTAAAAQINRILAGRTFDQWFAANPQGTIANFAIYNDVIWPGVSSDYLGASFQVGGFSLYRALNLTLRGAARGNRWAANPYWLVNYALSRSEASNVSFSPEFTGPSNDNRDWNARRFYGPTALDVTHRFNALIVFTAPFGLRFTAHTVFRTPPALSLALPAVGPVGGANAFVFGTDLNGDGRVDPIPGISAGQLGRGVKDLAELNVALTEYNGTAAGRITPHGQALVDAGLFTAEQLRRLGAVTPTIPLVPTTNATPWHNTLTSNIRLQRPFRLERTGKIIQASPYLDVLNVFNHTPNNPLYGGLTGVYGSFNFDYATAPVGQQIPNLKFARGRSGGTRLLQFGIRVDF